MLELIDVSKVFPPLGQLGDAVVALDHLSLHVQPGEFITIIGGNGSGKSTLLNVIAGSLPADQGRLLVHGVDLSTRSEHQRAKYLGRVFQDPTLGTVADMSVAEHLAMATRRGDAPSLRWGLKNDIIAKASESLAAIGLGLESRLHAKVGVLSGGQRQALSLVMATLRRPDVLLLDEHTAALDPKTAALVLELTERVVVEQQLTTLMVTHNMRDAIRYGNRLLMMDRGTILWDVSGEEKRHLTPEKLVQKFFESDPNAAISGELFLSK